MTQDRITHTIAILEPGYAAYQTERDVLTEHSVDIVPVGADVDAVLRLSELAPVAVMVRERDVTAAVMDACPTLKVVVRYGVGVDNIDLDHAKAQGIYVANVPDYGAENEVSEHAVALYLAAQHRLVQRDSEVRNGKWSVGQDAMIPSRENAILGLIGGGRIGRETARKFRALGFGQVLVFDPFLSDEVAHEHKLEHADLKTLCQNADVVSIHAPLTPDTHHIIDASALTMMKPTTILVNVARGGLVDEAALANALINGRLFGAGIDVFENEPVALDNPLLGAPNTIVSDHTAWYSERSVKVLQHNAAQEVLRVLRGEPPQHWVNRW